MQSKTQIDLLGERLKNGSRTETDLRFLDAYRRSFHAPYEKVTRLIREQLKLETTGRPAKSTSSVIDKLTRDSTRLSQIQDIAGCRVVVRDIVEQLLYLIELNKLFPGARETNRIQHPQYGYRAIHIIPSIDGKPVEIQLRSLLQHLWAELSEKYSDKFGQALKYGGGEEKHRNVLVRLSDLIANYEGLLTDSLKKIIEQAEHDNKVSDTEYKRIGKLRDFANEIVELINDVINDIDN